MSAFRKTYRVYWYDGLKQALSADLIEAVGDAEAIELAQGTGFGSKCELWQGHRLVAELGTERRQA